MMILTIIFSFVHPDYGELLVAISMLFSIACITIISIFSITISNKCIAKEEELAFKKAENEKNREHEITLSSQNVDYRTEMEKWERIYQVAKLISTTKNDKPDVGKTKDFNIPVTQSLISAIKEIQKEFDKQT